MPTNYDEKWHARVEEQRDDLGALYQGETLLYKYIPMPLATRIADDHNRAIAMEAVLREIAALRPGSEPALDLIAVKRLAERALQD